jgi:hypothetical protein
MKVPILSEIFVLFVGKQAEVPTKTDGKKGKCRKNPKPYTFRRIL